MATVELTKDNFAEIIDSKRIVLVDYWAKWCGPCRAFGPIFEQAAEKHPDIAFAKCDTEKELELATALQIHSIPTLMVFKDRVLVFSQPGMLPAPVLEELIGKVRELDMDEVRAKIDEHERERMQADGDGPAEPAEAQQGS